MYVELMLLCGTSLYFLRRDQNKMKRKWNQIMSSGSWFTNNLGKTLKILGMNKTEYGWDIKVEFPYSYTYEDFEKDLPVIREGFGFETIETEQCGNVCLMRCVVKKEFTNFVPYPLPQSV